MNYIAIKGRISQDLDIKVAQSNNSKVCRFSVAVRDDYKNKDGEYTTQFFNCVAFGKTAEFMESYFKKGQEILLSGRLQNRQWETDSGEKRYATDIIAEKVEFCGSKSESNASPKEETKEGEVTMNIVDDNDDLPF